MPLHCNAALLNDGLPAIRMWPKRHHSAHISGLGDISAYVSVSMCVCNVSVTTLLDSLRKQVCFRIILARTFACLSIRHQRESGETGAADQPLHSRALLRTWAITYRKQTALIISHVVADRKIIRVRLIRKQERAVYRQEQKHNLVFLLL